MKLKFIFFLAFFPSFLNAQFLNNGIIIGEGVRIRSTGSAKGTEISKVHGMRSVEILQEGDKWDALGKEDMCERHKWVKVKWEGDSTGWVYGKYVYFDNLNKKEGTPKFVFNLGNIDYRLSTFQNYTYPIADEEGITGCGYMYLVMIKPIGSNQYVKINDAMSKKDQSYMVLEDDDGINEQITKVRVENEQIIVEVEIGHQDGSASSVYKLRLINGQFNVVSYKSTER